MAILELKCACGQLHAFHCSLDDSTKKLAEMCGWQATAKGWICPTCARKAADVGRVVKVNDDGTVKVRFG